MLRDLDRETAATFQRILPFVFQEQSLPVFYRGWEQLYEARGVTFGAVIGLRDAGLVNEDHRIELTAADDWPGAVDGNQIRILYQDRLISVTAAPQQAVKPVCKASVRCFGLTAAGSQLMRISAVSVDDDVCTALARWFAVAFAEENTHLDPMKFSANYSTIKGRELGPAQTIGL